jgi:HK97 family phage major capsid protein
MTLLTSAGGSSILTPEQVQALVVEPLTRASVAMQISTVISTDTHTTRFPVVISDASSGWTPEGHEIDVSDPSINEIECTPKKLAALVVVSNELLADSNPNAATVVGESIVRDLARKVDRAFFDATTADGPDGLESLVDAQEVNAGAGFTDLDAFSEALSKLDQVDSSLDRAWVMHPATMLELSQIKLGSDFNAPLLGPDASSPTKRAILGVPSFWEPTIPEGRVWLVPKAKSYVVMRTDTTVVADTSAFFSSDRVGIRASLRVGYAFPHEQALVRIGTGGS